MSALVDGGGLGSLVRTSAGLRSAAGDPGGEGGRGGPGGFGGEAGAEVERSEAEVEEFARAIAATAIAAAVAGSLDVASAARDEGRMGGGSSGASGGGGGGGGSTSARWGIPLAGDELSPSWRASPAKLRDAPEAAADGEPNLQSPRYLSPRQASGFAGCPPTASGALGASGWSTEGPVDMATPDTHLGHSRGVGTSEPSLLSEPMLIRSNSLQCSGVLTSARSAERSPSGFPEYTLGTTSSAIAASFAPAPTISVASTIPLPPRPAREPPLEPWGQPSRELAPVLLAVPAPAEELATDLAPASCESPMRGFRFKRGAGKTGSGASLERIL